MNKILEKIKKGKVEMKPKSYFVLRTLIYILGIIVSFIFAIFFIGFIVFILRVSGIIHFPGFGFRGLGVFLASFPWFVFLFVIIPLIILGILSKKFSLIYKNPLLYSILGILIILLLIGVIFDKTPMHQKFFKGVEKTKIGSFYKKSFIKSSYDVFIGNVVEITDNGFKIETKQEEILEIIIYSKTDIPVNVQKNDLVKVMGNKTDSIIKAFGVRKIINNGASVYPKMRRMK